MPPSCYAAENHSPAAMKNLLKPILLVALLLAAAHPAWAQLGGGAVGGPGGLGSPNSGRGGPSGGGGGDDKKAEKPPEPPPSIPGATANPDTVIPADKSAAELLPNEALFDAITRGDIASARDALNRGAQLDAHNVLGQTPTEASISLDRNDITFLLLSMRGTNQAHATQVAATTRAPVKGSKAALHTQRALPSSDRGQPNPAAGFIGF
jgi:hypothetical protein